MIARLSAYSQASPRHPGCYGAGMAADKRFVYVLGNANLTLAYYVGLVSDVHARDSSLEVHSSDASPVRTTGS